MTEDRSIKVSSQADKEEIEGDSQEAPCGILHEDLTGDAALPPGDPIYESLLVSARFVIEGDSFRDQSQWRQAAEAYEQALKADPSLAQIWVQLGHACKEIGDVASAEKAYRSALELQQGVADTHIQLGHLMKIQGRRTEALASYRLALEIDPNLTEVYREVAWLELNEGNTSVTTNAPNRKNFNPSGSIGIFKTVPKDLAKYRIVFDVSDLIQYFHNARLPTGIQRVQIEVITNIITDLPKNFSIQIACFSESSDNWIEVPHSFFQYLCEMAVVNGDPKADDWQMMLADLKALIERTSPLIFPRGAYLINLGTSWWLKNYFLQVRAAKAKFGIHYVPFVHDCIPIMTPEHCVDDLTRDFISWALGAFQHADHVLVNSKATARDVIRVAKYLGHDILDPTVVTLDADFRSKIEARGDAHDEDDVFCNHQIKPNDYVLFVSTIESRKNHLAVFSAWLSLIKQRGLNMVPSLVCVGNRGWLNDSIYAKLASSAHLRSKVVMLSGISDANLERLYKNSLFTLYPSNYEGWGLPVTESLCYGKVPLLSTSSSLPEAGGDFADYFEVGDENGLLSCLEKLIYNTAYRQEREAKIISEFRPRPWAEVGKSIIDKIRVLEDEKSTAVLGEQEEAAARGLCVFPAKLGAYYGLTENRETQIWPQMVSGEQYRQGRGWWWTEPWGCWTKAKVAQLAFYADLPNHESAILFVKVRGVNRMTSTCKVQLEQVSSVEISLNDSEFRWVSFRLDSKLVDRLRTKSGRILVSLHFMSSGSSDFSQLTEGRDHRIASMGVCGFFMCAESDVMARLKFMECIAIDDLSNLLNMPAPGSEIPFL